MAAHALAHLAGEVDHAFAMLERSLSLNPNSASARISSSFVRAYLDDAAGALEDSARAQRFNPLDAAHHVHWNAAAMAHFCGGRYDEASRASEGRNLVTRTRHPRFRNGSSRHVT